MERGKTRKTRTETRIPVSKTSRRKELTRNPNSSRDNSSKAFFFDLTAITA